MKKKPWIEARLTELGVSDADDLRKMYGSVSKAVERETQKQRQEQQQQGTNTNQISITGLRVG